MSNFSFVKSALNAPAYKFILMFFFPSTDIWASHDPSPTRHGKTVS